MKIFTKSTKSVDYSIVIAFFLLLGFGLIVLASASSDLGAEKFDDSYYFLKHQILFGFIPGLILFLLATRVSYRIYKNRFFSLGILVLALGLLVLVFTPLGVSAKGATRWLSLGPLIFQPSELLKIALVIYLASWLSKSSSRQINWVSGLLPFCIVIGVISGLLLLQNSTAPVAVLVAVALVMYFMSGAKFRYILGVILIGVVIIALIVAITPYRAQRVLSYLSPESDPGDLGYHAIQARTAIGAGGVTGVGFGQSSVKYNLPEPAGDSVFAVLGEEFGFVGVMVLLALFLFLILRMFLISRKLRDHFGALVLIGFGSVIGIQAVINIGAMSGMLPLTGTPLPFISYGGTQLVVFMTMMGITVNISRYQ